MMTEQIWFRILVFVFAAFVSYLFSAVNPAIVMSKAIYHKDIREMGSGNPGFTNFKRVFGNKYAWWVFVLDLAKMAVLSLVFGWLFHALFGLRQLGVSYSGFFAMLGHAFPPYYRFQGGKGFLVCLMMIWFVDWRAGAVATAMLVIILLSTKFMSLASMTALISGCIVIAIFGTDCIWTLLLCILCVLLSVWRHRAKIVRLFKGEESKFSFGKKKE